MKHIPSNLRLVRWVSDFDFRQLSQINGSLAETAKMYRLKDNEAMAVTSRGWHRLLERYVEGRSRTRKAA